VMLPARNRKDFEDIPQQAREQLEFVWLEKVEDALDIALEPAARSDDEQQERDAKSQVA